MGPPYITGGEGEGGGGRKPTPTTITPPVQVTTVHITAQGARGTGAPCVRAIPYRGEEGLQWALPTPQGGGGGGHKSTTITPPLFKRQQHTPRHRAPVARGHPVSVLYHAAGRGGGARCSGDCTQAQYARTHHMHTRTREGGRGSESPDCPSRFPPSLCTTASVVPTAPSVAVRWVRRGLAQGVVYYSFPCTCRTRPCGPHTQVRAGG